MTGDSFSTWLCLIPFWFVCGLMAGVIYRSKGHSEAVGCIGGFLLGPLGILLALLSPRDEVAVAERNDLKKLKSGNYKACPYCNEVIKASAVVCPSCRHEQPSGVTPGDGAA